MAIKINTYAFAYNKENTMKKNLLAITVGLTVLLSGCSNKKSHTAFSLNIGKDSSSNSINPVITTAIEKGYDKKYDLSVSITGIERTGIFNSVAVGKIDGSYTDVLYPLSIGAQGADVVLYGGIMSGGQAAFAYKDFADKAMDIRNWEGRTIGVLLLGSSELVAKTELRRQYGFVDGKNITFKQYDSYDSLLAAASKGAVDIVLMWNSYIDTANSMGLVYLFPVTDLRENFVCCRQMAYGKKFREERGAYLSWLKAQIKAYRDFKVDTDSTLDIIVKASGQDKKWILRNMVDQNTTQNLSYNPDPNYNGVKAYYKTMIEYEYIKTERPLEDFFDISVYAQALKEVIAEYPDDAFYTEMWQFFVEHNDEYPEFDAAYL